MFKELFDFSYIFPADKDRKLLFLFMLTMLVYSMNIVSEDIPLSLALLFCSFCPIELTFFLFTFYSLFESVAVFSFGPTLNVPLQLVIFLRVVIYLYRHTAILKKSMAGIRQGYGIYWLIYAILAIAAWGNVTGVALFFRIIISLMVIRFVQIQKRPFEFWKAIFHVLVFSVLCSVVYGLFNETSLEREIEGFSGGSAFQLFGSLGTTRLGMFLVSALNYPLYFVKDKRLKYFMIAALTALTLMTVSMTATALLFVCFAIYLYSKKISTKVVLTSLVSVVLLAGTFNVWSKISFVEPVVARANNIINLASIGDMDDATTGREYIKEMYLRELNNRTVLQKTFGIFNPDNFDLRIGKLAHNSYIDIIAYNGLLGIVVLLFYCFRTVFFYRETEVFYPILSMKLVLLIAAYTVSFFTSVYWTWFLFL